MKTKEIIEKLESVKENIPDLIIKSINVGTFKNVFIISSESVSSGDKVNDFILKFFSNKHLVNEKTLDSLKKEISNYVPAINSKEVTNFDEILDAVFNGFTVIITDNYCLAFETRAELDRGINEPTSEPVIRGPKDSFTENYNKNVGLIRKRIKNKNLFSKEMIIGKQLKSKVCMFYMDNIVEDKLVTEVYAKISNINIDGLLDTNYIRELVKGENKTIFPTILSSERPDDVVRSLLNGKIILMMENSPTALVVPTLFIDFFQNTEDYFQKPFFSTFERVIRIFAFFLSILTPAFFLALITFDQEILPTSLLINFAAQRANVPFPALIEAFLLCFTFELLYEGDARTPSARGTSLSILGALVLGDAAVKAGLISPIMVIIVAVCSICSLLFVYFDLQGPIRFWRYGLMILASGFGIIGFFAGTLLLVINLCTIESFGKPYLLPLSPLYLNEQKDSVLRTNISNIKKRKRYLTTKNIVKRR